MKRISFLSLTAITVLSFLTATKPFFIFLYSMKAVRIMRSYQVVGVKKTGQKQKNDSCFGKKTAVKKQPDQFTMTVVDKDKNMKRGGRRE